MFQMLKKISREWRGFKAFNAIPRHERRLVIYVEDGGYWTFFDPVFAALEIEQLGAVLYVTSCDQDPFLDSPLPNMRSFYIGSGGIRILFFTLLDADMIVMTMPDLETFHIKRSRHPVKYVYLHHSLVSTHMVYRPDAFDHFDVVLCAGPHHIQEIKAREVAQGLPSKQLVRHGYGRLDSILTKGVQGPILRAKGEPNSVLLAPSWGDPGLLESLGILLINILLKADFRVIVRPHPRTLKTKPELVSELLNSFGGHNLFELDDEPNSMNSLLQADIMISDWSGAALEFALGLERPVLYLDVPRKIRNSKYQDVRYEPLESKVRTELGIVLKINEIHKAPGAVTSMLSNPSIWRESSRTARNRWVFNEGSSGQAAAKFLHDFISAS